MNGLRVSLVASVLGLGCPATAPAVAPRAVHDPPCATDPRCFGASDAVVATVERARWVVTIRDAGTMMETRAGGALRSLVAALAGAGAEARDAAAMLARTAESPADGFADLARRELRIAIRDDGRWVAFARLDPAEQRAFLASLKPSVEGDGTFLDAPTGLALRSGARWLTIAAEREVLPGPLPAGWDAEPEAAAAESDAVRAKIEAMTRKPCGDEWIRAVGECEGDRLSMRLRLRESDRLPIPGPVPGLGGPPIEIDAATVDRLSTEAILCEVSSMRADGSAGDGPVLSGLPQVRMPATFHRNLGKRRVVVVGEVEGTDGLRCPAAVLACEVEDPEQARAEQDALVMTVLATARRLIDADPDSAGLMPDPSDDELSRRVIPLDGPLGRWAKRSPWLATVALSWNVVGGAGGGWQVYASHPCLRDRIARELASVPVDDEGSSASATGAISVGRIDGERFARHLEGWTSSRERFPESGERFWAEVAECARIARHVPRLEWIASRRGPSIVVEIEARLSEP
jgi:hypothetical protein